MGKGGGGGGACWGLMGNVGMRVGDCGSRVQRYKSGWGTWVCGRGNVGNVGMRTGECGNAGQVLGTEGKLGFGCKLVQGTR